MESCSQPNMMSTLSTMITIGILVIVASKHSDGQWAVFPFANPMSGPNMCSAAMMSLCVMGQLGSSLFYTIFTKVFVLGLPILFVFHKLGLHGSNHDWCFYFYSWLYCVLRTNCKFHIFFKHFLSISF